ncbi:unnamed protein product [Debaryomyces tyrocola]|nr:unnamed protein product [Debaryomyces tyrocola]
MLLLLTAPPLYTATLYISLGLLMGHLEFQISSFMPTKFLIMIFVTGDAISFLVQLTGGVLLASGTFHTGQTILVSRLVVQIVFLTLFITIELTFYYRVVKYPDEHIMIIRNVPSQYNNWNSILIALLICSTLLLFRCIFRLIEGVQGTHGYLFSHEI